MIRTTSVVIAQVWRDSTGRQAKLSRFLKSVEIVAVDDELGRKIGLALAKSATRDVVDGSVVVIAQTGDWIATSDPDDIKHLVATSDVTAAVVAC